MEAARSCEKSTRLHDVTPRCVCNLVHLCSLCYFFFNLWRCGPTRVLASSFLRFLDHTQRRTTVGKTPLDEWSARRRDLYLTTHNTYNRQTSMPAVGFESTISAGERPQTYWVSIFAIETSNCDVNVFTAHLRTRYCQLTVRVLVNMNIVTSATCFG